MVVVATASQSHSRNSGGSRCLPCRFLLCLVPCFWGAIVRILRGHESILKSIVAAAARSLCGNRSLQAIGVQPPRTLDDLGAPFTSFSVWSELAPLKCNFKGTRLHPEDHWHRSGSEPQREQECIGHRFPARNIWGIWAPSLQSSACLRPILPVGFEDASIHPEDHRRRSGSEPWRGQVSIGFISPVISALVGSSWLRTR